MSLADLADLEWLIMPPLLLEQFRVFRGEATPVGLALWAYLTPAAEQKPSAGGLTAAHLKDTPFADQMDGALWLVEPVAPFATPENRMVEAMMADLMAGPFKGQNFKLHKTDPATGKRSVLSLGG